MIHSECSKLDKGSQISYYFIVIRVNLSESAVSKRAASYNRNIKSK